MNPAPIDVPIQIDSIRYFKLVRNIYLDCRAQVGLLCLPEMLSVILTAPR